MLSSNEIITIRNCANETEVFARHISVNLLSEKEYLCDFTETKNRLVLYQILLL